MPDRLRFNARTGNMQREAITGRELAERATIASDGAQRALDQALRDQQRQVDLSALETASADDIGRIIARLLRA